MASAFGNTILGENQYFFGVTNGGKPVGNDKGGSALHQCVHPLLYQRLGAGVDGGGGFVQNHDRRISHRGTGNGNELALPL